MKICPKCSELYQDDARFCPLDGQALARSADPYLGRTIASRYRLVKKLGQGGMSVVYLARHVMIDRLNAIKILRQDLTLDPSHRERFLREARAVNRIHHPNIVAITDYGEVDGTVFLVMEYAEGESLLEAIQKGVFAWPKAAAVTKQVAGALARAHEANVIHRDLKPENVLMLYGDERDKQGGLVKLTDFGIAKILDAPSLTFSEQMFGTPGYIAPELVEGARVDGRADLYALGVVLYEMISGKLPFDAKTQAEMLLRPLTTPPIPLSQRGVDVPPEIESLVLALLARNPDDRPRDAFVVEDTLAEVLSRYEGKPAASSPEARAREESLPTIEERLPEAPPRETANLGRLQTSEMASRWSQAIGEARASIEHAKKRNRPPEQIARAEELVAHAETLVANVERASRSVSEVQARVDKLESHARSFRQSLGHAIDVLGRDRSRERAHFAAIRERRDELEREAENAPPRESDAHLWEIAAIGTEEDKVRARVEDLSFQIVQLQIQLEAQNDRNEKELNQATAALEGNISAVRAMTSELVRTLDEAVQELSLKRR